MTEVYSDQIKPPPPGCRAIVEKHADGFRITIPAHGLVRGNGGGVVLFTLLWITITIVVAVSSYDHAPTRGGMPSPVARYVFQFLFSLVSTAFVLGMISVGWRHAVLTLTGDRLDVEEIRPLFGIKRA